MSATQQPPEPPVGTVLQTRDDIDTYRIEHLPEGWAIQYRPGESEHGLTHTHGRISWRAAWTAWGPPSGAAPFTTVPSGTPTETAMTAWKCGFCKKPVPQQCDGSCEPRARGKYPSTASKSPTAAPPRPTGGTAMSASIQDVQSVIASVHYATNAGRGPIQQLIDDVTRDRARLQASMDGTHQPDVEGAVAMLTLLINTLEDALGFSHEAVSAVERIGQRL